MELWIRTQDKEHIIKIDNIHYNEFVKTYKIITNNESACISIELGKYKTKKRALEILDEIQQILTPRIICNPPVFNSVADVPNIVEYISLKQEKAIVEQINYCVYQMPKE